MRRDNGAWLEWLEWQCLVCLSSGLITPPCCTYGAIRCEISSFLPTVAAASVPTVPGNYNWWWWYYNRHFNGLNKTRRARPWDIFIHSYTAQKGLVSRLPLPGILALITPVCCGRCQYPESHQIFSEVIVKYFVPCHHESLIMATGLFFCWHWTRYLETIGHPLGPGPGAGEGCQESEAELESLSLEQLNILTLRRCTALLLGWCFDNSLHFRIRRRVSAASN